MRRKTKEQRRIFGHCLISVPPGRYLVRLTTTKCSMPRPLLKFAAFFSLLFAVRRPLKVANRNGRKRQLNSQRETRFRTKSPYPIAPSSHHKMKQQDNKLLIIFLKNTNQWAVAGGGAIGFKTWPRKHNRPIDIHWISLGYHTYRTSRDDL